MLFGRKHVDRYVVATAGAVLGGLALAGCVGSTEPATNVEATRATLNARGTASNGPAYSSFEYWPTGASELARNSQTRSWPAGASGPFSETVERLAAATSYSFRVCGRDQQSQTDFVCAQTRTFTTLPPVEDAAHGSYFHPGSTGLRIDATSGPSGEQPRGSVHYSSGGGPSSPFVSFDGFVTCLAVNGDRAAIGAVGREFRTGIPGGGTRDATVILTVVDGRVAALDTHGPHRLGTAQPGSTPPDCATASFTSQQEVVRDEGDFIVDDARAAARR
jgi:hypothetical protein